MNEKQLISYIAPGAPATRRMTNAPLPFLRPEIGFTPNWYHERLGIDFGCNWHTQPMIRKQAVVAMRKELHKTFGPAVCGPSDRPQQDLLTGTQGACALAAIYGVPIVYSSNNWPNCAHQYLNDAQRDALQPPDLDTNPFFCQFMQQMEEIGASENKIEGFINWQGILNNAHRLRGEQLFYDMVDTPGRAMHLFDCICRTMIEAARRVHARQAASGVEISFFTVSNCLVNMISPQQYRDLLLPFDQRLAREFGCIGIHNCAWTADPYLEHYAQIPGLGYIDMGLQSDLMRARQLFPNVRRALMYTPMDLINKTSDQICGDLERIAAEYGPCDIVLADIEAGTPDNKVLEFAASCRTISQRYES